jgi:hypothetical protein
LVKGCFSAINQELGTLFNPTNQVKMGFLSLDHAVFVALFLVPAVSAMRKAECGKAECERYTCTNTTQPIKCPRYSQPNANITGCVCDVGYYAGALFFNDTTFLANFGWSGQYWIGRKFQQQSFNLSSTAQLEQHQSAPDPNGMCTRCPKGTTCYCSGETAYDISFESESWDWSHDQELEEISKRYVNSCDERAGTTIWTLELDAGWWRSSAVTSRVYKCQIPSACNGGKLLGPYSGSQSCAAEHSAHGSHFRASSFDSVDPALVFSEEANIMCTRCALRHFKTAGGECVSCESWVEFMWGLIGVYVGLGLALVALLLYLIPVEKQRSASPGNARGANRKGLVPRLR